MKRTDHCSNVPDEIFGIYVGGACKLHDKAYDQGGRFTERLIADLDFAANILRCGRRQKKAVRALFIAIPYFLGVRAFGWLPWHFKWRRTRCVAMVLVGLSTMFFMRPDTSAELSNSNPSNEELAQ